MKRNYKYQAPTRLRTAIVMDRNLRILEVQEPEQSVLCNCADGDVVGASLTDLYSLLGEGYRHCVDLMVEHMEHTRRTGEHIFFEYQFVHPQTEAAYFARCHSMHDEDDDIYFLTMEPVEAHEIYRRRENFYFTQLNTTLNHINVGVFVIHGNLSDRENVIIQANKSFKEMFDCPSGDPRDSKQWNHKTSKAHDNDILYGEKDSVTYEYIVNDEDGHADKIYYIHKQQYSKSGDMFTVVTTVTDVTELKKRIREYDNLAAKLDDVLLKNQMKLWEYDLNTQRFTKLFGYELGGDFHTLKEMSETMDEETYERMRFKYSQFEDGSIDRWNETIEMQLPDDGLQYIETDMIAVKDDIGRTEKVYGTSRIVTDIIVNEKKARQAARINDLVVNNVNVDLYFFNLMRELAWKNSQLTSPDFKYDSDSTKACIETAFRTKQMQKEKLTVNGSTFVATYIPVFTQTDPTKLDGVLVKVQDVTENEQTLEQLRIAKEEAEKSDRLKSAFLQNITHEIRTPLNSIQGFAQLIGEEHLTQEDRKELSSYIKDNTDSLVNLVNNVLDLSTMDAGFTEISKQWFSIDALFTEVYYSLTLRRERISPQVQFTYDPIDHMKSCQIYTDRNRVLQVLRNFCTNALKYTTVGSVTMGFDFRDHGLYIYVRDTGIGIAPEVRDKVFDRFEKLGSYKAGTGIGLTICKTITDAMGGRIGCAPNDPKGTIFYAWFPCERK